MDHAGYCIGESSSSHWSSVQHQCRLHRSWRHLSISSLKQATITVKTGASLAESNMFPVEGAEASRAKGLPVNKTYSVALAAVFLASRPGCNGKALTITLDMLSR